MVILPEKVTELNEGIFFECSGLNTVTITGKVSLIDRVCFGFCESLRTITADNTTKEEWEASVAIANWDYKSGSYMLICANGETIMKPLHKT